MKNIFITVSMLAFFSCKAQTTISLEEAYQYSKTADGIPESVTYVKDINNRLNQFEGTWKGSYKDKNYTIQLVKKLSFGGYSVKWDQLVGRIHITNNSDTILFNSFNESDENVSFWGNNFQNRVYVMGFVANAACNDSGDVYVEVKKNNPNEMTLHFVRDTDIYDPNKCPNFDSYVPLLPKEKMTLIKQ